MILMNLIVLAFLIDDSDNFLIQMIAALMLVLILVILKIVTTFFEYPDDLDASDRYRGSCDDDCCLSLSYFVYHWYYLARAAIVQTFMIFH